MDDDDEVDAEAEVEAVVDAAAGATPDGERILGPSLFEQVQPPVEDDAPSKMSTASTDAIAADTSLLQRSRVHWLVVRMSQRTRSLLSRPSDSMVRLVCTLRYFTALAETLPVDLLVALLEPILSPAYRCTSAFAGWASSSNLPNVQSLEEALDLSPSQRLEFLGQLAQALTDALSERLQGAGRGSEMATALSKVRKAVERRRADRVQKRRLLPVTDPQASALQRRAKQRRKKDGKKRKIQDLIVSRKGSKGGTRVKKSSSLL